MGRSKGSLGKKTLEKKAALDDFMVAEDVKPVVVKQEPVIQKVVEEKQHYIVKPVVCVGGPTPGLLVDVSNCEQSKYYNDYVIREIKRPNPALYTAAPESVYVYVPNTLTKNDSLTLFILDKYLELLK